MGLFRKRKGFSLLEVMLGMAIFTFAFTFIALMFFEGNRYLLRSREKAIALRLAQNKMALMKSYKNPLYIEMTKNEIEACENGQPVPSNIDVHDRKEIKNQEDTKEKGPLKEDIVLVSKGDIEFARKVDTAILDDYPPLVQVWVTVEWKPWSIETNERRITKKERVILTTLLAQYIED